MITATRGFVAFAGRGGGGRGGAAFARAAAVARDSRRGGTRRVRVQGGQPAARDLEVLLEPRDLEYVRALEQAAESRCAFLSNCSREATATAHHRQGGGGADRLVGGDA